MTKLTVNPEYEKGLTSKRQINALIAGKQQQQPSRLPKWLTDAFNLLVSASVGGACAWVAFKFLL